MHVSELELSPAALACLRAAGIFHVHKLLQESADELLARGVGPNELYEIICRLDERDMGLPSPGAGPQGFLEVPLITLALYGEQLL